MFVLVMAFVLGGLTGYILTSIVNTLKRPKTYGDLRLDNSDSDGPYLFLELHKDVAALEKLDYVTLKVKREDFLPRK